MSKDMFESSQQTPANMGPPRPSTPSWTPTRSVKKRPTSQKRPSIPMAVPMREAVSCFSKSQPAHNEEFYDLRTRQVPLSNSISELWAPYGIHEPDRVQYSIHESNNVVNEQHIVKDKREGIASKLSGLKLFCLMVLSAFLGSLFFAHMQQYFIITNTKLCSAPMQIEHDVVADRLVELKSNSRKLEDYVFHLSEKIKHLDEHFRKLQENVGSEVVSSSQRGILEELLIGDLACSGNLGRVLATPDTVTVTVPATLTLLGLPFSVQMNHRLPHTTIEGLIQEVGDCWPFKGSRGRLVLKLHRRSLVTGVSISHIPVSISASRDISSAPRHFQVLIHQQEDDLQNGQILGDFEYKTDGAWRQTFPLKLNTKDLVDVIEFRFLENHGNPNYTCVYRVHVHGETP